MARFSCEQQQLALQGCPVLVFYVLPYRFSILLDRALDALGSGVLCSDASTFRLFPVDETNPKLDCENLGASSLCHYVLLLNDRAFSFPLRGFSRRPSVAVFADRRQGREKMASGDADAYLRRAFWNSLRSN